MRSPVRFVALAAMLAQALPAFPETLRVRAEAAPLHAAPDRAARRVADLEKGTPVEVLERAGIWTRVVQPERGLEGYVFTALLEVVPASPVSAPAVPPAAVSAGRPSAELMLAQGRFAEAITAYREWLARHPGDATAHNRLGLCLQRTGQSKAARREYERAVKLDGNHAEAWNNLGTAEHVRGKIKQAVAAYLRAVEIRPDSALFHRNLASAYMEQGDLHRSALSYSRAVQLDPGILEASGAQISLPRTAVARRYIALAKAFVARGEPETALKFLLRARACAYPEFAREVRAERAFAELLRTPRYAEQIFRAY